MPHCAYKTHVSIFRALLATSVAGLIVVLSGCASAPTSTPASPAFPAVTAYKPPIQPQTRQYQSLIVGTWYGNQPTTKGGQKQWIITCSFDGTFVITFQLTEPDGEITRQVESGDWGIDGKFAALCTRYIGDDIDDWQAHIIFSEVSSQWDIYEIIELTDTDYVYQSVETGNRFSAKRVPDDFTFPENEKSNTVNLSE